MARTAKNKEGRKAEEQVIPPTVDEKLEKFRQSQTKAKNWLWLGVISISAIIFFFWGWSLISNLSLFSWKKTQENSLVKKTQTDWNEIFTKTAKEEQEKKLLKDKLGVVLDEIKKQAELDQATTTTSTITTTTTLKISTTTTSTIR